MSSGNSPEGMTGAQENSSLTSHTKTKTDITDHTVAVAEAFGLGISDFQQHIICDDVELKVGRGGGQLMSPKFFRWNIFKVR